jgi:16S rRNA G1207 methylase RsmC
MVATALARLRPGGEAWLVANEALPYQAVAAHQGCEVHEAARGGGFKVWRARRRSDR